MLSSFTWGMDPADCPIVQDCYYHQSSKAISRQALQARNKSRHELPFFYKSMTALVRAGVSPQYSTSSLVFEMNWALIPFSLTVAGGHIPSKRLRRKVIQVENMMSSAFAVIVRALLARKVSSTGTGTPVDVDVAQNGKEVVVCEFCAGSGFVALPLSFLFPEVTFVLIDAKVGLLMLSLISDISLHCYS